MIFTFCNNDWLKLIPLWLTQKYNYLLESMTIRFQHKRIQSALKHMVDRRKNNLLPLVDLITLKLFKSAQLLHYIASYFSLYTLSQMYSKCNTTSHYIYSNSLTCFYFVFLFPCYHAFVINMMHFSSHLVIFKSVCFFLVTSLA